MKEPKNEDFGTDHLTFLGGLSRRLSQTQTSISNTLSDQNYFCLNFDFELSDSKEFQKHFEISKINETEKY